MTTLTTLTPAILFKLGPWTPDNDLDLPRRGYGFKGSMSEDELVDATRAWWVMSPERATGYAYAAAVARGVIEGVWAIDHGSWRSIAPTRFGTGSRRRWAFDVTPAPAEVVDQFVGRAVPDERPDGRKVFGSGAVVAYWPR